MWVLGTKAVTLEIQEALLTAEPFLQIPLLFPATGMKGRLSSNEADSPQWLPVRKGG